MRDCRSLLFRLTVAGAACCVTCCGSSDATVGAVASRAIHRGADAAEDGAFVARSSSSDAISWDERMALERDLANSDPAHAPRDELSGVVLETDGVSASVGPRGALLRFRDNAVTMMAARIGREGSSRRALDGATPEIVGPEVRSDRGDGVVEWWRSLPSGIEHGVTFAARPGGHGRLFIELELSGELSPRAFSDDAIDLIDASGRAVARYAHLSVVDAEGAHVPARMEERGGLIVLAIDDARARYPLVVDPLIAAEEAMLLAPDGARNDAFGVSVALSADGSRALVGAHQDDTAGGTSAGSAHVFVRTGTTWAHEAMLLASDGALADGFGRSVSISEDGSVALVGADGDDTPRGADTGSARVFVRTGTVWSLEATLLASDGATSDRFGISVALSADGSQALVGAYGDDTAGGVDTGSARVFVRTGTVWSEEATLLASDAAVGDRLGWSVSLSGDGSRALVGARYDDTVGGTDAGSARVFVRSGTAWSEEATLVASDGAPYDELGWSVSLSSDGSRAIVGAPFDDTARGTNAGSARVFVRTTSWAEEATLLASDGAPEDWLGQTVSLSSDGSRALVGAPGDDTVGGFDTGSARLFVRTVATWTAEPTLLAPDAARTDFMGYSGSLSADGVRALLGAYRDDTPGGLDAGSARVFTIRAESSGTACSDASTCPSGFCVDGFCCDSACGGGAVDCQACSAALTGGADGACAPLAAAIASSVTCRAAVDLCDLAEVCTAGSVLCPPDAFVPAGTVCRPAARACDAAPETCTGASPACPPDVAASPGTICRPAAGACDVTDVCDGSSFDCPADARAGTDVVCRPPLGPCDVAELCDGSSVACPADAFRAASEVCRPAAGTCDVEDRCSGTSGDCPDTVLGVGVICRPLAGACDVAEACDGTTAACPSDALAVAGTECAPSTGEACDAPDVCTGASAECALTFLSGVECRASRGACDPAELCTGGSPSCPPDAVAASGTECRASSDSACDPAESCDGTSAVCPANVTTCGAQDAGSRDGGARREDAGAITPATESCGCRVSAPPTRTGPFVSLVVVAALAFRRCRRKRCGAGRQRLARR